MRPGSSFLICLHFSLLTLHEAEYVKQSFSSSSLFESNLEKDGTDGKGILQKEKSTVYPPSWDALDKRPLPLWYDGAKIGIFVVWGVYSVPSVYNEWFWYRWKGNHDEKYIDFMKRNYKPNFTYADFAPMLTAEFLDTEEWAKLFKKSGAQYVVFTTKHHDGYTMWPSQYSYSWNSVDLGPKRDIVGELVNSLRRQDIRVGLYHSLYEWFHPLYLQDKANNYRTKKFVTEKTLPELYELVNKYKPDIIWSDGDWEAASAYWNSTEFIAWLYNESPVKDDIVTNDRWGKDATCKHGGFFTCQDRFNPGKLQKRKWENAMTIDKLSWGFRRNAQLSEFITIEELIATLVETISCGGNILINVAPSYDGTIQPLFQERLTQLGQWLNINFEAIYGSYSWKFQNDTVAPRVWYASCSSIIVQKGKIAENTNNDRQRQSQITNPPKSNSIIVHYNGSSYN